MPTEPRQPQTPAFEGCRKYKDSSVKSHFKRLPSNGGGGKGKDINRLDQANSDKGGKRS